ncbi:MAG TPA: SDR family NAD(P)-dependent oxidoreductase [Polyangia bacterium]|nr:SDR family NAD(P)-dependent oxidoreductase [Polyangia bacterium]
MKAVLLGATKGIGRALARGLVARGDRVFLLGRDRDEVQRSAGDLEVRAGTTAAGTATAGRSAGAGVAGTAICDLEHPDGFACALDEADAALGGFDTVVVTAGLFAKQDRLENDRALARRLLTVDFANTVVFCEEARARLLARGGGTLCVFSSVAGERGRKPVVLYGAAKAGLSRYLEALDHKFRAAGLRTVCIKPGFVRTGMTDGLPVPPFAATADAVAARAIRAIDRGKPVAYAPPIWALVMLVIRWLPRFVMRRIGF